MKNRTQILLAALLICAFALSACGGAQTNDPATPSETGGSSSPSQSPTPSPSPSPQPSPSPSPEPDPDENKIIVTHAQFGDIVLTLPDDDSITVELAEPGQPGLDEFDFRTFRSQRAYLKGDGFTIVLGFIGYGNMDSDENETAGLVSFEAHNSWGRGFDYEEREYGGNIGWRNDLDKHVTLYFPATTIYGGRIIAVLPEGFPDVDGRPDLAALLDSAPVKSILDTLELRGEIKNETMPAIQPVDDSYISYTAKDGWVHIMYRAGTSILAIRDPSVAKSPSWTNYNGHNAWIFLEFSSRTPQSRLDGLVEGSTTYLQVDNMVINEVEWIVVENESDGRVFMITSRGPELQLEENGILVLVLHNCGVEGAMPLLETMTPKARS